MISPIEKDESLPVALTPRQEELIELLAAGLSNKEIAVQLGITHGTVKQHLFVLYRRLGVASRAKALLAVGQTARLPTSNAKPKTVSAKKLTANSPKYGWRMISVVSIYLSDGLTDDPAASIARDQYLNVMRSALEYGATALDGRFATMPYGGFLAWFGHPQAHTDDADRAVSLGLMAQRFSERYVSSVTLAGDVSACLGRVGVAVASQAEIVAHDATALLGAETFRRAAILARYASGLGLPLADQATRRLAPLGVSWHTLPFREKNTGEQVKRLGALFALDSKSDQLPLAREHWGGLRFLDDVLRTSQNGISQWLAVECWPSTIGIALTDAIGTVAQAHGFQVVRLRLSSARARLAQARSLCAQIDAFVHNAVEQPGSAAGTPEQLIKALSMLCTKNPVALLVYGLKGLERLTEILGTSGIEALVNKRIFLVCAGSRAFEKPQTSLRLVGVRPGASLLSRVYSLKVPAIEHLPDRVRIGLQELLDSLSVAARLVVMTAAAEENESILAVAKRLKLSERQLQDCLNELTACGLVVPASPGHFQFRDRATGQAIAELNVLSGSFKNSK